MCELLTIWFDSRKLLLEIQNEPIIFSIIFLWASIH